MKIWGPGDPGICNYLYFAGMLRQLGARADVRVVTEKSCQLGVSPGAIALQYIPGDAMPAHAEEFTSRLSRSH